MATDFPRSVRVRDPVYADDAAYFAFGKASKMLDIVMQLAAIVWREFTLAGLCIKFGMKKTAVMFTWSGEHSTQQAN